MQIEVARIVAILEESPLTTVAPLRHMMRKAGQDHAGKACHNRKITPVAG